MLRFYKNSIFILLLATITFSCKKTSLSTQSDFLSKDDSDPKAIRQYKTWTIIGASVEGTGFTPIIYTKGQPIQGNFDPSKISFVFSGNNTFQGTDEKGIPTSGKWQVDEVAKTITIQGSTQQDVFKIVQLTKTNFDFSSEEIYKDKPATVTIKMIPKI